MIGRRLRSTRGRVAVVTLVTFSLVGLVLFAVMERTSIIDRVQDIREDSVLDQERDRLARELEATGTVAPREGRVKTIVVPADRLRGFDPFGVDAQVDPLPPGTDLSPAGLDPALFDSHEVFYPLMSVQGWRLLDGLDGSAELVGPNRDQLVLSAVVDDAVLGPFSVGESLLLAIPVGSMALAAAFALVAGTGLRPVRRMTSAASSIEIGDLDRRLADPGTGDELDELAATLNGMLDRVSRGVATERRFVADAAHELRSPIAASTALLEVSLSTSDLDWRTAAASVLDEQRRLAALVDDLVLLARLDDQGTTTDPTETTMLDDIVATEASRPLPARIDVVHIEPVAVDADRRSLERAVRNLLSNAGRHAETRVEVRLSVDGASAVLHVDDDGPGIPAHERARIFDRFARLDDARSRDAGGSGIGLAIVKQVVERQGGSVVATGSPLGGARLTVTLPLSTDRA